MKIFPVFFPSSKRAILLSIEPVSWSPTAHTYTHIHRGKSNVVRALHFCIRNQKLSASKSFFSPRIIPSFVRSFIFIILCMYVCDFGSVFVQSLLLDSRSVFVSLLFHVSNITRLPPKGSRCIDCSDTLIVERRVCQKM